MKYRALGSTGFDVSIVGIGGGGIGQVWGPTSEEESVRAVHRALELGVNFFDVAPGYGAGKAEQVLGTALHIRNEPHSVATKVRLQPDDLDDIPGAIRRGFESSLGRLGMGKVDLLQLHNGIGRERGASGVISTKDALGPVLDTLRKLQSEGLTTAIGFTGYGEYDAVAATIDSGEFATVQLHYNLLHPNAIKIDGTVPVDGTGRERPALFERAHERGLGIIGIRPLAAGALADEIDRTVAPESRTKQDIENAKALHFLVKGPLSTFSQASLVFVLQNRLIATTIPGIKNVAEVEDAVSAVDLPPYSREELLQIARATHTRG
jgi:aryl-alcohol dehydrogenase-like predicted oxidoreductase